MSHHHPEPPDRRTFLDWAIHGLGAIFAVILGIPVVGYLTDPRNRVKGADDFRPVSGVRIDELEVNRPVQGTIRNVRRDAWTLYPDDVIGRVWVNRTKAGDGKDSFQVFSTVCPHLGCSINCNADQNADRGFTCPCHNGRFDLDGSRLPNNPATRGMFVLDFEIDGKAVKVKYVLTTDEQPAAKA